MMSAIKYIRLIASSLFHPLVHLFSFSVERVDVDLGAKNFDSSQRMCWRWRQQTTAHQQQEQVTNDIKSASGSVE